MSMDEQVEELVVATEQIVSDALISQLVATARRYPRDLKAVVKSCRDMVTMSPEFAAGCFYKLPRMRRDKNGNDVPIEGPSIRMAEVIASCWTNLHIQVGSIPEEPHERGRVVKLRAQAFDAQNNYAVAVELSRRTTTKDGRPYGDDMRQVTAAAATSFAFRNAVFRIVPRGFVDELFQLAKDSAVGPQEQVAEARVKAINSFAKMGISEDRVLDALQRSAVQEITREDVGTMRSWFASIRDGQPVDDFFPPGGHQPEPSVEKSPANGKAASKTEKIKASASASTSKSGSWRLVLEDGGTDDVPQDEQGVISVTWGKTNTRPPISGDVISLPNGDYCWVVAK